jgi:PAS domain S-box-containing protein
VTNADKTPSAWSLLVDFEAIAESIPHIAWLADGDGEVDYVNDRVTAYTGYPRQAHYGWKWLDLVHPDDTGSVRLAWRHATTTAAPFELSCRVRRADGQFRWHICRALLLRGGDGRILRWIGTADDLDDPMLPNDKAGRLQRQTTELRTLLEGAGPLSRPSRLAAELARGVSTADLVKLRLLAAGISDRDLEVLRLLAAGHTNSVIANLQTRSLRGVEASRARVRQLLGLQTRAELVQFARDAGLE